MVSTIKYRSFKDMKFSDEAIILPTWCGDLGLMLVVAWPQAMLFVIFAGYAFPVWLKGVSTDHGEERSANETPKRSSHT